MVKASLYVVVTVMSLLAACSGGRPDTGLEVAVDKDGGALCESIGGPGATTEVIDCVGCSLESPEHAGDGDPTTASTLLTDATGFLRLRVTAAEGIRRDGFSTAGILMQPIPRPHPEVMEVTISTYLQGVIVQALPTYFAFGNTDGCSVCTTRQADDQVFIGAPTVAPYDAVEIELKIAGNVTGWQYSLFEVCGE